MDNGSPSPFSKFRASIDARASFDSRVLEDPLVIQLLTENEMMLIEIETLKKKVDAQEQEMQQLRSRATDEEAAHIRDTELLMQQGEENLREQKERDDKKVSLLKPILDSLVRYQYEMAYFSARKNVGGASCSESHDIFGRRREGSSSSRPSTPSGVVPESLTEANGRYEHLYHLIASYQATPSFTSSPYDSLVLDSLNHIIALSKTMNTMVYEQREREQTEQDARERQAAAATLAEESGVEGESRPESCLDSTPVVGKDKPFWGRFLTPRQQARTPPPTT